MTTQTLIAIFTLILTGCGLTWKLSQCMSKNTLLIFEKIDEKINEVRDELKDDIKKVRDELKDDIKDVRDDIKDIRDDIKDIRNDIHKLDKRLHGMEVLQMSKVCDPINEGVVLEDEVTDLEEG